VATANSFTPVTYASGQLAIQGTPHNAVHNAVGGDMSTFFTAGLDPLFWLHHCEIDRLWNLWLAQGGGRSAPLSDSSWTNASFTFYDENGNAVHMTPCNILRAAQQLSYVYEVEPPQVNQYCNIIGNYNNWMTYTLGPITYLVPYLLYNKRQKISLGLSQEFGAQLYALAKNPLNVVLLQFANVEAEADPKAAWEVYVGEHGRYKTDPNGPNFVGNVSLYSDGIMGQGHNPAQFIFPLNRALGKSFDPSSLEVAFVPTSGVVDADGNPVRPHVKAAVSVPEVNVLVDTKRPQ
jgi:tyrosinase